MSQETRPVATRRPAETCSRWTPSSSGRARVDTFVPSGSSAWLYNVRYTLTYEQCDNDGDSRPDSDDNCPTVANIDQRDFDADGLGDACDADMDGDGADDSVDNCQRLANDQTDSDRDGIGNACDATPYPPAPPTPGFRPRRPPRPPTTTPTTAPTTPPAATTPAAAARTVSLRYRARRHALTGVVASDVSACEAGAAVTLWQKRRGADRRLVIRPVTDRGRFRILRIRRGATYYVTVAADAGCTGARSREVRARR